jgi:hypothetical protein
VSGVFRLVSSSKKAPGLMKAAALFYCCLMVLRVPATGDNTIICRPLPEILRCAANR